MSVVAYFGDGTAAAVFFGDGTPTLAAASVAHAHPGVASGVGGARLPVAAVGARAGSAAGTGAALAPVGPVVFTTTGSSFSPVIELTSGSSATVTWQDSSGSTLATGLTPTISFGSAATRTVRMVVSTYAEVKTINLGFDHTQDTGRAGPGAGYDKAAESVTGVTGLGRLTGMVQFMAANTALTGTLDLTGCSSLLYVECFDADLTAITLTGCTSLRRVCLELNRIDQLDVNPVASTLEDLRAALQNFVIPGHALDFVPLTGDLPHLWHYCVRDQTVTRTIPHAKLPVVEQHWAWNTGQTTSDSPISTVLNDYDGHDNTFDAASVNRILIALNTLTSGTGRVDLSGSAAPTGAGITAKSGLISRGWTVTTG